MNALMVPDAETERADALRQGPGQRLRALREAQALHLADVARALHLSPATLEQLERDDFASLPNSVFVQGYLRNYARFLGEPVEPYIQAFNQLRPDPQEERQDLRASRVPIKIEVRSNHVAVRLVSWGIAIALIALLGIWGKGFLHDYGALLEEDPLAVPAANPPMSEPMPLTLQIPVGQPKPPPAAATPATNGATATETSGAAPTVPKPPAGTTTGTPGPAQPTAAAGEPAVAHAEPPSGAETATPEQGDTTDPAAAADGQPPYKVVLEMVGKSWVDVRDATGKLVVVGELNTGEKHELSGKPPFTFVFGKSSRVRMTVNGKPFDIERHSRRDVARFSLDPTQG
jgi:cytoskeleton protein RodZ